MDRGLFVSYPYVKGSISKIQKGLTVQHLREPRQEDLDLSHDWSGQTQNHLIYSLEICPHI